MENLGCWSWASSSSRYQGVVLGKNLEKIKAGGISVIATYIFWIYHEEIEGEFDWTGRRDLRHFLEL
jgi:beta-galactosidase GanA